MADAVTNVVVQNDKRIYEVHMTCISDGTGETNVVKIDRSTLLAQDGAEPSRIDIEKVRWCIQGFTYIKLSFDHTTDDVAMVLSNNGYEDFASMGDPAAAYSGTYLLQDPASAGGTGDLLLTSIGATAGDTYDITLTCRLRS